MAQAPAWAAWRREVFGDPYLVWHEGPEFTRLLSLARSDLTHVAAMLAAGIRNRDPVAASSFGALAEDGLVPDGAEAVLRAAARRAHGTFLVRVAQALRTVTGDEAWCEKVASVLRARSWSDRVDAAIVLAYLPATPHLIRALARAVADPEYLVRYHAANALIRYAGGKRDVAERPRHFRRIAAESDRAAWRAVAEELASAALSTVEPAGARPGV